MTTDERAAAIRVLLLDVDGVLTDGTTLVSADGAESLRFSIRDGLGLVTAQRAGLVTGLVSARSSMPATHRAAHLGLRHVRMGVEDKLEAVKQIAAAEGVTLEQVAYMGDDLVDLPVLARVGLAAAPADAAADVRARVHLVASAPGGHGAVRELVEFILRARDAWTTVVSHYEGARE